jgi:hypothetical protein
VKLTLRLRLKKMQIPLAQVSGELEVKPIAEAALGGYVREKIVQVLTENGFVGEVVFDDDEVVKL